ncbi:PfkB family carbohydrate kinase [Nocardia sp. NPDC055321]
MEVNGAVFVGLATLDLAYTVERYPAEDTKTRADELFLGAGGPAANAAVAYAHVSGRSPDLITALGEHPLAEPIRDDLRRYGVTVVDLTPAATTQPPVSSIVVATGSATRTIVSLDGSRIEPRLPDTAGRHDGSGITASAGPVARVEFAVPNGRGSDVAAAELLGNAAIVLVDGHYAEPALRIAAAARAAGVPVVLDAGRWRPVHAELLPLVDIAICSAAFAPPGVPAGSPDAVFDFLHAAGPTHAAVTNGAAAIRYSFRDPGAWASGVTFGRDGESAAFPRARPGTGAGSPGAASRERVARAGEAGGGSSARDRAPSGPADHGESGPGAAHLVGRGVRGVRPGPGRQGGEPVDDDRNLHDGASESGYGAGPSGDIACARGEVPVPAVAAVDTLGAGDILHGAFCHFHALGEVFPVALRHAAEVAALSCASVGTREWMGGQTIL